MHSIYDPNRRFSSGRRHMPCLRPLPRPRLPAVWTCALAAAVLGGEPSSALAQENRTTHTIHAVRVDEGPAIDARLDDEVWSRATVIDGFVQQEPREGEPATERTEVRMVYDAHHLYIGIRAFDSAPDRIVATEMRRDADRILEEDNFQIILDTFMDSRSAYMFVVNPLGAKLDQQVFEEGEGGRRGVSSNVNRDWDGVWHAAAARTADGWVAEIAIPMVTLRFPDSDPQSWGINFMRNIRRKNEQAFWAPVPRAYGLTRVSLAGSLTDLHSLERGRDLRIKPFAVGGGRRVSNGAASDNSVDADFGLDLKYGLGAGFNVDVTVNTDFAQAEVDDERANLTRFPLFFPEKRDFFLENAGQFNVGTTTAFDRIADLFFSRRIGLSESGEHIPILGGARLTGRSGRHAVAAMNIQTDDAFGRPGENFLVTRYSRDILERSRIGGLFINKQAMEGGHFNRTFAADAVIAPHANLTLNGFLARTATRGLSGEEMGGHVRAGWLSPAWNVYAEHSDLQENFNPEVGFVPRVGIRTSKIHFERTPRPGRFGIRLLEPMYNLTYTTDQSGRLLSRRHHYMLGTRFENGAYLNIWYNGYLERLDDPFSIRPDVVIPAGRYDFGEWRFSFRSDASRRLYYGATYSPQTFFGGTRTDADLSLGVRFTSQLATEASYSRNDVDLPEGAFTVDIGALRLDYAVSPDMSLRTLTQYNSLTRQWSTAARFRYTYRPGSDLYIVYDEIRQDAAHLSDLTGHRDHQLIVKMTYLFSL